jgi:glycosyltransferase involved in cell wall biosynthesis
MVIALIANTSWNVYNFRKNLLNAMRDNGHTLLVIAPKDTYSAKIGNLCHSYYPLRLNPSSMNLFLEIFAIVHLFLLLRKTAPDCVISFTPKCNLYVGLCKLFLRFQFIPNISGMGQAFEYSGLVSRATSRLYRVALKKAHTVFFQNKDDMERLVKDNVVHPAVCRSIPGSGVDTKTFKPSSTPQPGTSLKFLMFGRLVASKGWNLYFNIAEKIKLAGKYDAEFWTMALQDNLNVQSKFLLNQIFDLKKQGIIHVFPPSDNMADILHQFDIVVLPSTYHEGIPRSLLEAMACGKPIITTNWKGCKETVHHGINGYIVKPNNEKDLYDAAVRMIRLSTEQRSSMGIASRKLAVSHFDESIIVQNYLEAISATNSNQ